MNTDELKLVIGWALRRRRQSERRTLKDVADQAGIALGTLAGIETGKAWASIPVLARLCVALDVSLLYLFADATRAAYQQQMAFDASPPS